MPTDWTLTIDLREDRDFLVLEMALLSGERLSAERQLHWIHVQTVDRDIFAWLFKYTGACFNELQQPDRELLIEQFGDVAGRSFALDKLHEQTVFSDADTLTIHTTVTSIPWDLVHFQGQCLGHKVAVGLRIPTLRTAFPQRRVYEQRPRFLHIVSNPFGDLTCTEEEVRQLEGLVKTMAPGLEYQLLDNPSPVEVISTLTKPQITPFVHYSGHVKPGEGLELAQRLLKLDEIVKYFPYGGEVVFLNGCDAVYDLDALVLQEQASRGARHVQGGRHRVQTFDMFQLAAVANAFLDAGARAVIAPRTRLADNDACEAAIQIWSAIFARENLGTAVRRYRQGKVQADPESLAGYSFILYGAPSTRVEQWVPQTEAQTPTQRAQMTLSHHPLVQEASADAGGPIAPQHLFGALTRRWIVGHLYFSLEGDVYIETLEQLRQELGIGSPQQSAVSGPVEFTKVGAWVLRKACARANGNEPDELAFLEALTEADDLHIALALQSLDLGPRRMAEFIESARQWIANGRPVPQAIVNPDGYLNREVFLPDLPAIAQAIDSESLIDIWDLLVGLVTAGAQTAALWQREHLPAPPPPRWIAGQRLYWAKLTTEAKDAVLEAMQLRGEENRLVVNEGLLLSCVMENDLTWDALPTPARRWCSSHHIDETRWERFVFDARIDALSWL